MKNKKTLTIVVLIAVAVVFIMLFGRMPSQTPSTGTPVNGASIPPSDVTTPTPQDQTGNTPNNFE